METTRLMMSVLAEVQPAGLPCRTYHYKEAQVEDAEGQSTILKIPVDKLKAPEFRYYLKRRMPLMIMGINQRLQLPWSPTQLSRDYGEEECTVEDCEGQTPPLRMPLATFLQTFTTSGTESPGSAARIWKVKVRGNQTSNKFI